MNILGNVRAPVAAARSRGAVALWFSVLITAALILAATSYSPARVIRGIAASPGPTPVSGSAAAPFDPLKINLVHMCPQLKQVTALERQAQDAEVVLNFEVERAKQTQIALQYYRCQQHLLKKTAAADRYGHDLAALRYVTALKASLADNAPHEALQRVFDVANDLAANSAYSDIRNQAAEIADGLPLEASHDPEACQNSGFLRALDDWRSAYDDYAARVSKTNKDGVWRGTIVGDVAYNASRDSEAGNVNRLGVAEEHLTAALQSIRASGLSTTMSAAQKVLAAVHTTDGYAGVFSANGHIGWTGITDRNNIVAARITVDNAAIELTDVYCRS